MAIEDYWVDGESYHIEFVSTDGRCWNRELIVPMGTTEETIKKMIQKSFQNIKEIKSIDTWIGGDFDGSGIDTSGWN